MAGFLGGVTGLPGSQQLAPTLSLASALTGRGDGLFKGLNARRRAKKGIKAMKPTHEG